ncbi:MAG: Spy/CpxP family protein refolding chaperone [Pyrinomonadaceae bacterium]
MKRLGKVKTLAIASLSAIAIATPIALAQNVGTGQDNKRVAQGEHHGQGKRSGGREGRGDWGKGEGRGFRGGGRDGMFRGITLTDDQKARMQAISQSFRERTQSLHQQLQAQRQELRQANDGGTFNEALATQKLTETASLEAKLMGERFKMRQEMKSVLTAEQKAQIEQKRAEFKAKRGQRSERKVQ